MSDGDKAANEALAGWLFDNVMGGKPGLTLDVGAAYPYLASRLKARGCYAHAIDGELVPNDLGVTSAVANFESDDIPFVGGFALITLIHSFEHAYNPVDAVRRLRRLVADDGRVFIRSPDHSTPGYERDLTPGHYSIHPFYHTLTSILQCCVEAGDCFEVESYEKLEPGQMQIVLRPISRRPTLALSMIVKNEERDLPRALKSARNVADGAFIIDTGSTDDTERAAEAAIDNVHVDRFTGASEQDAAGDWKLQDFSAARNKAIEFAELHGDWIMWLDADDVLITPDAIRRATYWPEKDCFSVWIESGNCKWLQHRLFKAGKGVRFHGRCHEYPALAGLNIAQLDDAVIAHHADPHPGESSNERNLRILLLEWAEAETPRTAFYIANTHRDAGRHKEAAEWYGKRIAMGGYRDEWLFAQLYRIRSARAVGEAHDLDKAMTEAPDWMEFRMEAAHIQYAAKLYEDAIKTATPALDAPIPPTQLWREPWNYKDAPARLISWCHEHLGNIDAALEWAKIAKDRIGVPDADWDARIARLKGVPAIVGKARDVICVRRAGAIGDVLMTLNLLPALKAANPDSKIWYFTDPKLVEYDALGWIIAEAGADQVLPSSAFDACGIKSKRAIDLVGYPLAEGYPDKPMRRHLLEYFATELGLGIERSDGSITFGDYRTAKPPVLPALTVRRPEMPELWQRDGSQNVTPHNYATLQWEAGWSKYKMWQADKWSAVIDDPDIPIVIISEKSNRTLAQSIALFANARMHIGIDSFCNHLTQYYWTDEQGNGRRVPGVILWGSTQASAAGYPSNTNISLGLPCQPCFRENPAISRMPRGPCINPPRPSYDDDTPHACMRDISVEQVVEAVRAMWSQCGQADQ